MKTKTPKAKRARNSNGGSRCVQRRGSATRFTFMSDDGKYPLSHDGKVQWLSNREETIRQAKSWGFNILVEMDDQGHLLGMVNLKSPNTEARHAENNP